MSHHDNSQPLDDERSAATVRAEDGADAWCDVVRHQRGATADHADFYALAGDALSTLVALENLTRVLGPQVAGYAHNQSEGWTVYDDSRTVNPAVRLAQAAGHLETARAALDEAGRAVNAFWSAISHIGVEVTR